ncbi:MAG: Flp pilus assembly complex ATPase component TadA [Deltaproteobacteria bacterium]|nr:Flp pilus assembly complex ATPase component TadA [Deltaproteobacteria bacterium]
MAQPAPAPVAAPVVPAGESILDQVEFFRPLPEQLKRQLESRLVKKTLKTGEILFNQGDPGDAMYMVWSGQLAVFLTDNALGLCVDLAKLGPGQSIGEMALVTGQPRSASVRAMEESQLLGVSRDIFYALVQAAPQVGIMVAGVLAKRLDTVNKQQGIEFGTLKGRTPDPALLETVPSQLIKRHKMVPVSSQGGVVLIATPDPANRLGLDDIKRMLGDQPVQLMAVSEQDYSAFVATHLGAPTASGPKVPITRTLSGPPKPVTYLGLVDKDDEKLAQQAAASSDIVNLVSAVLAEGIERGASDIHMEPERKTFTVRYRIDGRMVVRDGVIPMTLHLPIVSRLKVLAQVNIAEKRLPQDGRISLEYVGKPYDLRLATVNTKNGEKITMRILDASKLDQNLGSIIVAEKVSSVIRKLFYRPNGLVLVTGPTGSGKTTTLYASLRERMNKEISICTVEDPIEYDLAGVTQVQVNEGIGLGFAEVLRTFMRQDPDIILVGETRDGTTARLACNAALTGHLVLSSFHTNDAPSAVIRLRSMEVEPYLIASSLLGVVNQRLVRRICPACRVEQPATELVIKNLQAAGVLVDGTTKFFKGTGCDKCNNEGFKGRVGVYELLLSGPKVRDAISQKECSMADIRNAAADGSYVSLARFSTHLLSQGYTVPSEIIRILPREDGS